MEKAINSPKCSSLKNKDAAGYWWLMLVILATWEAEIRRISVSLGK
jgi:hypothetical protein